MGSHIVLQRHVRSSAEKREIFMPGDPIEPTEVELEKMPGKFKEVAAKPKRKRKTKAAKAKAEDSVLDLAVKKLPKALAGIKDLGELRQLLAAENKGAARSGALTAIAKRIKAVEAEGE